MIFDTETHEIIPTAVGEPCSSCMQPVSEQLSEHTLGDSGKKVYVLVCPPCSLVCNLRLEDEPYS